MHKLTSKPIIFAAAAVAVLSDNDKVFLSEPIRVTDGYFCKTWWWKLTSQKLFVTPIHLSTNIKASTLDHCFMKKHIVLCLASFICGQILLLFDMMLHNLYSKLIKLAYHSHHVVTAERTSDFPNLLSIKL